MDSAAVYVNASTRFTDGFGWGWAQKWGYPPKNCDVRGPIGIKLTLEDKRHDKSEHNLFVKFTCANDIMYKEISEV